MAVAPGSFSAFMAGERKTPSVKPGSFSAFLASEKPAAVKPVKPGSFSAFLEEDSRGGLITPQEGIRRGELVELAPPAPVATKVQRLAGQAEQLEREKQHRASILGIPLNLGDYSESGGLQSLSAAAFAPVRAGLQILGEAGQVGSRAAAPALHGWVGDFLTNLLQQGKDAAVAGASHQSTPGQQAALLTPRGLPPAAATRQQSELDFLDPEGTLSPEVRAWLQTPAGRAHLERQRHQVEAEERRVADAATTRALQGDDILGPAGMPREQALAEQAGRARVAANPDRNWVQKLSQFQHDYLTPKIPLPGGAEIDPGFMFDQNTEDIYTQQLRRNPDAPAGALLLDMLASPNPLALIPGGAVPKLPAGLRTMANLVGIGSGVGSELPVVLTKALAEGGLDLVRRGTDALASRGGRLGKAGEFFGRQLGLDDLSPDFDLTDVGRGVELPGARQDDGFRRGIEEQARARADAEVRARAEELAQESSPRLLDLLEQNRGLRTAEELRQARRAGETRGRLQFEDDPDVAAAAALQRERQTVLEQRRTNQQDLATQQRLDQLEPPAKAASPLLEETPTPAPLRTSSGLELSPAVSAGLRDARAAAQREIEDAQLLVDYHVNQGAPIPPQLAQRLAAAEEQLASLPGLEPAPAPRVIPAEEPAPRPGRPELEVVREEARGNIRTVTTPQQSGPKGRFMSAVKSPLTGTWRAKDHVPPGSFSKFMADEVQDGIPETVPDAVPDEAAPTPIADPEGGLQFSTPAGSSGAANTPAPAPKPAAPPSTPPTPIKGIPGWADPAPIGTIPKSEQVISSELGDTLGRLARGELAKPGLLAPLKNFFRHPIGPRTVTKLSPDAKKARALGVYSPGADLVELRRGGDMPTLWHETGHRIEDYTGFIGKQADPEVLRELELLGDPNTNIPKDGGQSSWKQGMSDAYKRGEGYAEYLRLWFHHPAEAQKWAPKLSAAWNSQLDALKDVGRQLRQHQMDFQVRLRSEPQARLRSLIRDEVVGRPLAADDVITALYDDLRYVDVMSQMVAAKKGLDHLPPTEDPLVLARMLRGVDNKVAQWLDEAPMDFATQKPIADGKSLKTILGQFERPEEFLDWRDYMVARRAQEIHADGKVSGVKPEDADVVFSELHSEKFERIAEDFYEWEDSSLRYARDAGYLSAEGYQRIKTMVANHVPFHRVHEVAVGELGIPGGSGVGKGLQAGNVLKRFKGSNRDIFDPIQTSIKNMAALITATEKNRVGLAVAKHWDDARRGVENDIGWFVNEVTPPTEVLEVQMAQMMRNPQIRDLMETLGGEAGLTPEDVMAIVRELPDAKIFRESNRAQFGSNTIQVKAGDKWRFFQMQPELYKAWTALDQEVVPKWLRMLSAPANLLRRGATSFSPLFAVYSNPIRDVGEASTVSRVNSGVADRIPVVAQARRVAQGLRLVMAHDLEALAEKAGIRAPGWVKHGDDLVEDFIRLGGAQGMEFGLASEGGAKAAYKRALGDLDPAKVWMPPAFRKWLGWGAAAAKLPVAPWLAIRGVAERLEQATRYAEVERALKVVKERNPGWSDVDVRMRAAYEGRDLLDFGQGGNQVKTLRRIVPFFGSMMSGNYRLYRAVEEVLRGGGDWKKLATGAGAGVFGQGLALLTLPTIGLYMLNRKDEHYKNLPQHEKDLMWHLRYGSEPDDMLRIPKPHLLGTLFASTPERFLTWLDTHDPKAFEHLGASYAEHILGPAGPLVSGRNPHEKIGGAVSNMLGPLGQEGVEGTANFDFFTRRDVEPQYLADRGRKTYMPWHERSNEYTSLLARKLGQVEKSIGGGHLESSPMLIDHAINGLMGVGGRSLVQGLDLPGGMHWPGIDDYLSAAGAGELPKQQPRELWGAVYTANWFESVDRFHGALNEMQDVMESSDFKATTEQKKLYNQMKRADEFIRDRQKKLRSVDKKDKERIFQLRQEIIDKASEYTPASAPPTNKMKEAPK